MVSESISSCVAEEMGSNWVTASTILDRMVGSELGEGAGVVSDVGEGDGIFVGETLGSETTKTSLLEIEMGVGVGEGITGSIVDWGVGRAIGIFIRVLFATTTQTRTAWQIHGNRPMEEICHQPQQPPLDILGLKSILIHFSLFQV